MDGEILLDTLVNVTFHVAACRPASFYLLQPKHGRIEEEEHCHVQEPASNASEASNQICPHPEEDAETKSPHQATEEEVTHAASRMGLGHRWACHRSSRCCLATGPAHPVAGQAAG